MIHSPGKTHFIRISLFSILILLCNPILAQKNEMKDYNVDSTLYNYYQRCKEQTQSPVVLSMSDTLFKMAAAQKDQRMQAVALSTILDYYYFQGLEDSIYAHTNRVKAFAIQADQPKYYYFAWGKRLIQYYIKRGKVNTALYESEEMLRTAQKADDKYGLATCYATLANIYTLQKFEKQAFECKQKELELIETYDLDKYNLSSSYLDIASYYIRTRNPEKAWETLKKAEATANNSSHIVAYQRCLLKYYLYMQMPEKAATCLQQIQTMFKTDKRLAHLRKSLYGAECDYYLATRQFQKALDALENNYLEQTKLGETGISLEITRQRGEIYWLSGNKEKAADDLKEYIHIQDSINAINEQKSASEFGALLGLEKLKAEKQQVELDAKQEQLQYSRSLVILLVISLGGAFVFLRREYQLNKKLKKSEDNLIKKNQDLLESSKQLSLAKERAEKASLMKTAFIQNMTHEIRTPLNSIVGFSQVISSIFKDKDDCSEYANIIEENSQKLLKLIDDVLSISDLESNSNLEIAETNINDCCDSAINEVKPYVKYGVICEFQPVCNHLSIQSNARGISQILFNLLHNASKFTDSGSIVLSYTFSDDKSRLLISVTDTGSGIPIEKHEVIFGRFTKLDEFSQGSGLGLSVSRLMAQKLGGNLEIDREYRGGSRFILTLPM